MDYPKSLPNAGLVGGKFVDEDAVAGMPGSMIPSAWGNSVTDEILKVIESAGIAPDEDDSTQMAMAIRLLVQADAGSYAIGSGIANAYSANYTPPVNALQDGMVLRFRAGNTNTGASTFSPNGMPSKPIVGPGLAALTAGSIAAGGQVWLQYNASLGAWVSILSLAVASASTATAGTVRLATPTETQDGASGALAVTPQGLASQPLESPRIDIASAGTINLTTLSPRTRHINITGSINIAGFTVAAGKCYFVRFAGSPTITNSASLVTQRGSNIAAAPGDTCVVRSTAANVVELLHYTPGTPQDIGSGQTTQNVTSSRAFGVTYTNSTGRTIYVNVCTTQSTGSNHLVVGGENVGRFTTISAGTILSCVGWPVAPGENYSVTGGASLPLWTELRA